MERSVLDVNIIVADKDTYDGVWLFYKLYSTLLDFFLHVFHSRQWWGALDHDR